MSRFSTPTAFTSICVLCVSAVLTLQSYAASPTVPSSPTPIVAMKPEELQSWVNAWLNITFTLVNAAITIYHLIGVARRKEWQDWFDLETRPKRVPKKATPE